MQRQSQEVHEARGIIVLLQEDRFRLETENGRSLLFILGPHTRLSVEDLEPVTGSRRKVTVRYYGEPEAGAVALAVCPD